MGCNGNTPNVICPSDPTVTKFSGQAVVPVPADPTFSGPLNNYVAPPIPNFTSANGTRLIDVRVDHYVGNSDQVFGTFHYRRFPSRDITTLPKPIATENTGYGYHTVSRLSWDHTFSPTLLITPLLGTAIIRGDRLHRTDSTSEIPRIPGVASNELAPVIGLEGFNGYGCNNLDKSDGPSAIFNDLATWVRGKHTFKFGGEYRRIWRNGHTSVNQSGSFNFSSLSTGLIGVNSGNPVASFLLEQVDRRDCWLPEHRRRLPQNGCLERSLRRHLEGNSEAESQLRPPLGCLQTLGGKDDHLSFFDPVGPNPGAANRPGRLAFAGTEWGDASFGKRHPEETWYRGFAPRVGIAFGPDFEDGDSHWLRHFLRTGVLPKLGAGSCPGRIQLRRGVLQLGRWIAPPPLFSARAFPKTSSSRRLSIQPFATVRI